MSKKLLIPLFVLVLAIASVLLVSKLPEIKPSRDCEMEIIAELIEMGYNTGVMRITKKEESPVKLYLVGVKLNEESLNPMPTGYIFFYPRGRNQESERKEILMGHEISKIKTEDELILGFGKLYETELPGIGKVKFTLDISVWRVEFSTGEWHGVGSLPYSRKEILEILRTIHTFKPEREYFREIHEKLLEIGYYSEVGKAGYYAEAGIKKNETYYVKLPRFPAERCQVFISREEIEPPIDGREYLGEFKTIIEDFRYPPSIYSETRVEDLNIGVFCYGKNPSVEETKAILSILKETVQRNQEEWDEYFSKKMEEIGYYKVIGSLSNGELLNAVLNADFVKISEKHNTKWQELVEKWIENHKAIFLWVVRERDPLHPNVFLAEVEKECPSDPIERVEISGREVPVYLCKAPVGPSSLFGQRHYVSIFPLGNGEEKVIVSSKEIGELKEFLERFLTQYESYEECLGWRP